MAAGGGGEQVKKDLIIEISAEGVQNVRRAFGVVAGALKEIRDVGRVGLKKVNDGFQGVGRSAAASFRIIGRIAGTLTSIGGLLAGLGFGAAIVGATTLLGTLRSITQAVKDSIAEEKRLTSTAAIFGIEAKDGNSAAKIMGAIEYAFEKSNAAEGEDVKDILTPLIENIREAQNDPTIATNLGKLGFAPDGLYDAAGRIKDINQILDELIANNENRDAKEVLAALVPFFGDSDSQKMAILIQAGLDAKKANEKEFLAIRDLTEGDEALSKRIQSALAREAIAIENLGTSLKRGFGGAMAAVSAEKTQFIESIRGDLEDYARIFGASYERVMEKVFATASRIVDSMKGVSGTLTDGPLEGWLRTVEGIIGSILNTAAAFVEYFATGKTDSAFVNGVVEKFNKLSEVIGQIITKAGEMYETFKKDVWPTLDKIGEFFGADAEQDWQSVGIIAALILFSGTITNILKLGGSLIGLFAGLAKAGAAAAGPFAKLAGSLTKIDGAGKGVARVLGASGFAGAAVTAAVAGGAAGAAIGKDANLAEDYAAFGSNIERVLQEQGKSEAEIAAYLKIAIKKWEDANGGGSWLSAIQSGIDAIPGIDVNSNRDVVQAIDERIKKGLESGMGGLIEAAQAQALADFANFSADSGSLTISGVDFTNGVQADIDAGMRDITATLPVHLNVEGALQRLTGQMMTPLTGSDGSRYYGDADDPSGLGRSNLTPVNLYVGGQMMAQVLVTDDAYEQIQRSGQVSRRAR